MQSVTVISFPVIVEYVELWGMPFISSPHLGGTKSNFEYIYSHSVSHTKTKACPEFGEISCRHVLLM